MGGDTGSPHTHGDVEEPRGPRHADLLRRKDRGDDQHAYWIYTIDPDAMPGVWTVEIRINGQPAGSHSFELALPVRPKAPAPAAKPPSLDEIYRTTLPSLVWVHRMDPSLRRIDSASGFVFGPNQVATAFQAIDGAVSLEIEFSDNRKVLSNRVQACDRDADWAIVVADTQGIAPLVTGDPRKATIGERLIVFDVENGRVRLAGGVDLAARQTVPGFGERFRITPALSLESQGGPLLDSWGKAIGILGGSLTPGSRSSRVGTWISPGLWTRADTRNAATPVTVLPKTTEPPVTLETLLQQKVLTPPVQPVPYLTYCGTTRSQPKAQDMSMQDSAEFSRSDREMFVYTMWQKKDKTGKILVSARVYDLHNRQLTEIEGKRISLQENISSVASFRLVPDSLGVGTFRVDILVAGVPVARTFFQVAE